jgi:hypothetical protein
VAATSLDAILESTRQVPLTQWATAKHVLDDALAGAPDAHHEATLNDESGVCVLAQGGLVFVRYDERGLAVTFLGSLRGGTLAETTTARTGTADSVGEFDVRLRCESRGQQLSIQTSSWQLEQVLPIRDLLRAWSSSAPPA